MRPRICRHVAAIRLFENKQQVSGNWKAGVGDPWHALLAPVVVMHVTLQHASHAFCCSMAILQCLKTDKHCLLSPVV